MSYLKSIEHKEINNLKLHLTLVAEVLSPHTDIQRPVNKYTLTIKNKDGEKKSFKYWGSIQDFENNKYSNIREVLYAILLDATSYINAENIDDFANELGYDKISEVNKAFSNCKRTTKKLKELGLGEDSIFNMVNNLNI